MSGRGEGLSEAEMAMLEDALRLTPARRLELLESLWTFARQVPGYRPRVADQMVRESLLGYPLR